MTTNNNEPLNAPRIEIRLTLTIKLPIATPINAIMAI